MTLSTDNVQSTGLEHRIVLLLPLFTKFFYLLLTRILAKRCNFSIQTATEHDIGTATSHIGGNGDAAAFTGVGNKACFLVILARV